MKEYCALDGIFRADSIWIDRDEVTDLLARLEAAEKALLQSEYQEANPYFDAWRKASGKEPKA